MTVERRPKVSYKKAQNAIDSYCPSEFEIEYDDILVLIDDTFFGTGKNGLLITKDYICCKEDFSEPFYFETDDITKIEFKKAFLGGTNVFINGDKVMHLAMDYNGIIMSGDDFLEMIFKEKDKEEEYEKDEYEEDLEDEDEYDEDDEYEEDYEDEESEEIEQEPVPIHYIRVGDIKEHFGITKRNEKTKFQLYRQIRYCAAERPFADLLIEIFKKFRTKITESQLKDEPNWWLVKFFLDNTIKMRNYIEKKPKYKNLLNDIATAEFFLHSVNLIKSQLFNFQGAKEKETNYNSKISSALRMMMVTMNKTHIIYQTIQDLKFSLNITESQIRNYRGINFINFGELLIIAGAHIRAIRNADRQILINLFYWRLFLSNYKGKTCKANIDPEIEESIEFMLKDFDFLGSAFDTDDDYALYHLIGLIVSDDKNSIPKKFAIEELRDDAQKYEISRQVADYSANYL